MKYIWIIIAAFFLGGCSSIKLFSKKSSKKKTSDSKSISKILKNPDPAYKLRIAEQYFVNKKYSKAQILYEDVMPYYKTGKEFEDIYYKYAYCAYNLSGV